MAHDTTEPWNVISQEMSSTCYGAITTFMSHSLIYFTFRVLDHQRVVH